MWTRFIKILIELNIMKPSRKAQAWSLLGVTVTALIFRFFRVPFSISSEEGLIMAGVLSVIGLYILARRIYGWQIAGIAAFLAAISHWHVQISRSGSEEIWLVLIITFVFYFVWEGLRTNHLTDYIWAGVLTAAGLYNYENFYLIIPFLIIIFIVVQSCSRQNTGPNIIGQVIGSQSFPDEIKNKSYYQNQPYFLGTAPRDLNMPMGNSRQKRGDAGNLPAVYAPGQNI